MHQDDMAWENTLLFKKHLILTAAFNKNSVEQLSLESEHRALRSVMLSENFKCYGCLGLLIGVKLCPGAAWKKAYITLGNTGN